jgi:Cellulase M and related proteins
MELLEKLIKAFGPSGREDDIAEVIIEEIKGYVDEVRRDRLGNVIAHKKGRGLEKIMVAAHMDQIGIVVTDIEKNGAIRFSKIGNYEPSDILHHLVIFKNGILGTIACEDEPGNVKFSSLYIDIGVSSREEVLTKVRTGDFGVFKTEFLLNGNTVLSGALDNRLGCYAMIKAIKNVNSPDCDIYFVFTAQEESYLSGAAVSAYEIEPDYAIVVDVSDGLYIKMGCGAAIRVMDRGIVYHREIIDMLKEAAEENNIKYQLEVSESGRGEGYEVYVSRAGVKTGAITIPVKYNHTPNEIADIRDVESAIQLIVKTLNA